ncbi:hypothetical protein ACS3SW_02850 [Roseobacteraceae bacterium S113]
MTLITPERKEQAALQSQVERIRQALSDLEAHMEDLGQQVRTGEVDTVKEAGKTLQELRQWMRVAMETEKALDEYAKRESGLDGGYALDLTEARRQIGCRLARLSPCCKRG